MLIAVLPTAVVPPIIPAISTAPAPDVIVRVFAPSIVEVKPTSPPLDEVSIVVLPARLTAPVRVTSPTSASPASNIAVVIVPLVLIVPPVIDTSLILLPLPIVLTVVV